MPEPTSITIGQSGNSWAELIDNPDEVSHLWQLINSLELVETDEEFESLRCINAYFGTFEGIPCVFEIDKKGVVRLNRGDDSYRVIGYDTLFEELAVYLPYIL